MPTETNPALILDPSAGQLYMKPLDGGDPVHLGRVIEFTQTVERHDYHGYHDELGAPVPVLIPAADTMSVEFTLQPVEFDPATLWRLTHDISCVIAWAVQNRPKLWHLANYAKTYRKRRKNVHRILREFMQEVGWHG